MLIRRATVADCGKINQWVLDGTGYAVDFAPAIAEPLNVFFVCGKGGALAMWRGPGIFEVHVFFGRRDPRWKRRGLDIVEAARTMLEILRKDHGAKLFWTSVPVANRTAKLFARRIGFKSEGLDDLQIVGRSELFSMPAEAASV